MQKKALNVKQLAWLILFILAFAACGYFREYYFVQINNIMYMKYYNTVSHLAVGMLMQPFQHLSYDVLYYSKYPATLLWTFIFFSLNYALLRRLGSDGLLRRLLVIGYLLMLGIAALSMLYGYFVHDRLQSDEYTLSRWLLGIAQGPIPGLLLGAAARLR
jgi:hypothetical protein